MKIIRTSFIVQMFKIGKVLLHGDKHPNNLIQKTEFILSIFGKEF